VAAAGALLPFAEQGTWLLEGGEGTYWPAGDSPGEACLLDGHSLQVAWREYWGRHHTPVAFEPLSHAQTLGTLRLCRAPRHPLCPSPGLFQTRPAGSLPRTRQSLSCDFCQSRSP